MIEVELLKQRDEFEYSNFLSTCEYSIAQHTLGWRKVVEEILKDKSHYFVAKENGEIVGVLPTFIKKNPIGNIMNSIPFAGGYGGVVTIHNINNREMIYKTLIHEMVYFAKQNECVLVTISVPPFSSDINLYKIIFKPDYILENFMQYIELSNCCNYKRDIKKKIKKAIKVGVEITEDVSMGNQQLFYEIYKKRMLELNAKIAPLSFLGIIKKNMSSNSKFLFAKYEGKIVFGRLLIYHNNIIDSFFSALDMNYSFTHANDLLTDFAINWAKKNGFKFWNWQSSPSRESGVYKFKAQWGCLDGEHYYLTKVLGDLTTLKKSSIEQIKNEYEWYFVIPYNQLKGK